MSEHFLICPGAQKAGTTTLYHDLQSHPDICAASKKETRYFLPSKISPSKADYLQRFFPDRRGTRLLFDVDPEYMYFPEVPEGIHRTLGNNVCFIFLLRNPIDRAYSHYWMSYRRGFVRSSFEKALKEETEALESGDLFKRFHLSFMDRGFYARQISGFMRFFSKEHMKFVRFEDYKREKEKILTDICNFAGLNPTLLRLPKQTVFNEGGLPKFKFLARIRGERLLIKELIKPFLPTHFRYRLTGMIEKYNKSDKRPPPIPPKIKKQLITVYRQDIAKLEQLTNLDLSIWL